MTFYQETSEAFGHSVTIERWEPLSSADLAFDESELDEIMQSARDDAEQNIVDFERAASCAVYRATILKELQQIVRRQARALLQLKSDDERQSRATFALGFVDHEAGNSSWTEDF